MVTKVCHISTVHSAYDTRIFHKECKTLSEEGYDVNFIVNNDKDEVKDGVNIIHLINNNGIAYRFFKKRRIAFKKAVDLNADIYHFHDPELIPVGIKLKKLGKKVIYDVHEDVPEQILTKEWLKTDFIRNMVSKWFDKYEKKSVKYFDKIITVTPQIANKFPKEKIVLVRNFSVLSTIDRVKALNNDIKGNKNILIYAGGLTKIRGIKEIIKAVGLLDGKVELWLLGKWENENYQNECKNEEGWKFVKYFGLLPQEEVYSYMKLADIGIVNFWPVKNHINAVPNKPFEYMACSIPMIMSDFEYWGHMFKGCFVGVNPVEPKDIANKINMLISDKNLCNTLANNGRNLVENKYSWENEKKKLLDVYNELK